MSKKSLDYLKEAKAALAVESDYALAKALKTSHVNISNYMNEKSQMDDYHCIKVAQVLGIDPMEIIAAAQEEREKNPEKQEFWRDFRKARSKEHGHASVHAIGMLAMTMMGALLAVKWPELATVYIMSNLGNAQESAQSLCHPGLLPLGSSTNNNCGSYETESTMV